MLVVAAPAEAKAVLSGLGQKPEGQLEWAPQPVRPGLSMLVSGIGKANAAAATAIALCSGHYQAVINLGIAGSLPIASPMSLGQTITATRSIYADEGLLLPDGSFVGCADMGFPVGPFDDWGVRADRELLDLIAPLTDVTAPIATVSTCSGTNALARAVVNRTWAVAEAMEGAAVGQVASRLQVPFVEVRVISNTTGDRQDQAWSIGPALAGLGRLASGIASIASTAP